MKKKLIFTLAGLFVLAAVVWAANYGGDTTVNNLTDVSASLTRTTSILVQDSSDVDVVGVVNSANIFGLLQASDIPDLSATYELATSNDFDPDRLLGDTTDDDLIDQSLIAGMNGSATPSLTFNDTTASATGTADVYADAYTAGQDSVMSFYVDDSAGEDTEYLELDGVNEDIEFKKPATGTSLALTGDLSGNVPVTLDTAATVTLTAADCRGGMRVNNDNDVIDYTLPAAAAGLSITVYSKYAAVVTIDTADTSDTIWLDGTALTAGNAIDSPGTSGDFISLLALDASTWITLGRSGTWVDGGAD